MLHGTAEVDSTNNRANKTEAEWFVRVRMRVLNMRLRGLRAARAKQIGGCSAEGQCHRTSRLRPPCT